MNQNGATARPYVVLRNNSNAGYARLGTFTATGATQAARRAAAELAPEDVEHGVQLVAIPEHNWTEHTFQLKHETRIVTS